MHQLKQVIAFMVVAIWGSSWLFILTMTFMNLVSPALSSVRGVMVYIAFLSVLAVFVWRAVSSSDFALSPTSEDGSKKDGSRLRSDVNIENFRRRSRWCRITSLFILFVMVAVVLLGFTVAVEMQQSPDGSGSNPSGNDVVRSLTSIAVLVIFMRTLALVYRYNLRLASFYDARADYLCLADKEKTLSHKELLELVGTNELGMASTKEFWRSLLGRSSFQETTKNSKSPPS